MHAEESMHDVLRTLVLSDSHGILLRCEAHVTSNLASSLCHCSCLIVLVQMPLVLLCATMI